MIERSGLYFKKLCFTLWRYCFIINDCVILQVYTFGCNDEGALGRSTSEEGSETQAGKVDLKEKIIQISAGDSHTAALTDDGRIFMWGTFRVRGN